MSPPIAPRWFVSSEIAARIERAEASLVSAGALAAARRVADRQGEIAPPFAISIAGGVAAFAGPGSPLNKVAGLGFDGAPAVSEWTAVEAAYALRRSPVQVEVATLGDPAVAQFLTGRGYSLVGFENVVGRSLATAETAEAPAAADRTPRLAPGVRIEENALDDIALWLDVIVSGFAAPDTQGVASDEEFPRQILDTAMRDLAQASGFVRYLARLDGELAGGASARFIDGVAQLNGAATLPSHRRRGVQSSLLEARLLAARQAGCDLAVATTQPGSKSQENLHRLGFELLYARAVLRLS